MAVFECLFIECKQEFFIQMKSMVHDRNSYKFTTANTSKRLVTSKSVDPLTPLTLIYDSVALPIMCKCMYRKSSRIITCNTALNGQGNLLFEADYVQEILASVTRL